MVYKIQTFKNTIFKYRYLLKQLIILNKILICLMNSLRMKRLGLKNIKKSLYVVY